MPMGQPPAPPSRQHLIALQQMLGLVSFPNPKPHHSEPIFVCIDCEAFEDDQQMVTEIGVATLDTRDITGGAGSDGRAWLKQIKYAHYRPVEYAHIRNKKFIKGCPDSFNFGDSTWVNLEDAKMVLSRLFEYPASLEQVSNFEITLPGEKRNVVFVGHGAKNDVAYLRTLGFDISSDAQIVQNVDTQLLAGGSKKKSIGLLRLLLSLGIEPVNLHNAGNDAAYTLQAMVLMALKDHTAAGSVSADLAKHAGKLPPSKRNQSTARHVCGGTAVKLQVPTSSTLGTTLSEINADRRKRKHAARKARQAQSNASGSGSSNIQKLLPAMMHPSPYTER